MDRPAFKYLLHRVDQALDMENHARVECRSQRPAGCPQGGGKLVPARHRFAREFDDHVHEGDFVGGVASSEHRGHGEGGHLFRLGQDDLPGPRQVQGYLLDPHRVMPSLKQVHQVPVENIVDAALQNLGLVVSRQQYRYRSTPALHHGIGGQRGGQ